MLSTAPSLSCTYSRVVLQPITTRQIVIQCCFHSFHGVATQRRNHVSEALFGILLRRGSLPSPPVLDLTNDKLEPFAMPVEPTP